MTARGAATREAILDAALELFARRGFHGTSIADIATHAGIGQGTIYRHFESKEALGRALYNREKNASGRWMAKTPVPPDFREAFRALFTAAVAWSKAHPLSSAFLELHHHQAYLEDATVREPNETQRVSYAFFDAGKAAGVVKDLPNEVLAVVVFGIYVQMIRSVSHGEVRLDDATVAAAEQCAWDAIAR